MRAGARADARAHTRFMCAAQCDAGSLHTHARTRARARTHTHTHTCVPADAGGGWGGGADDRRGGGAAERALIRHLLERWGGAGHHAAGTWTWVLQDTGT